jgi:hypothetical protein
VAALNCRAAFRYLIRSALAVALLDSLFRSSRSASSRRLITPRASESIINPAASKEVKICCAVTKSFVL